MAARNPPKFEETDRVRVSRSGALTGRPLGWTISPPVHPPKISPMASDSLFALDAGRDWGKTLASAKWPAPARHPITRPAPRRLPRPRSSLLLIWGAGPVHDGFGGLPSLPEPGPRDEHRPCQRGPEAGHASQRGHGGPLASRPTLRRSRGWHCADTTMLSDAGRCVSSRSSGPSPAFLCGRPSTPPSSVLGPPYRRRPWITPR